MTPDAGDAPGRPIPRRIVVSGTTGSGKTTLGRALAERLGVPHIELDALFHGPGWVPYDDFRQRVASAVTAPAWIADGGYGQVRDLTWGNADMIIWLDFSFARVISQLFRRTMRRWARSEELWNGNRESLRSHFLSRQSLFLWAARTHWRHRREYPDLMRSFARSEAHIVRLRSPRQRDRWLATFNAALSAAASSTQQT